MFGVLELSKGVQRLISGRNHPSSCAWGCRTAVPALWIEQGTPGGPCREVDACLRWTAAVMSTYLAAKVQEVFIEPALDLLCPSVVRGGSWQPVKRCLGLTGLRRHQSAQSHKREDFFRMSHLAGQLHRSVVFAPSSSAAGHRAQLWGARQNYKGQISTLYIAPHGSVACTAAAALTEQTLSNGAGTEHMRGLPQEACAAGHLSADGTAFLEEHRIRGYEVGPDQQTTIVTMANLLQVPCPSSIYFAIPSISMSKFQSCLACNMDEMQEY